MVYDTFIFFNELDLLEIRLNELHHVVDKFIVVESPVTFTNRPKPLHFSKNRKRFQKFANQILHLVVEDMPLQGNSWAREEHQRRAQDRLLAQCSEEDIIIFSDADEIPSAEALTSYEPSTGPRSLSLLNCYYYVNCISPQRWHAPKILTYRDYRSGSYGNVHELRKQTLPCLEEAGWHFSFLGGPAAVKSKLESYSHQELNQFPFNDETHINTAICNGTDLFHREIDWRFIPLGQAKYPDFLIKNRQRFRHLIRAVPDAF